MWKSLVLLASLVGAPLAAQARVDIHGMNRTWTDLGQPVGNTLYLDLEAAGVSILPSEDGHVRTRFVGTKDIDLSRLRVRFDPAGNPAELRVSHTPHNNFEFEIQVPRSIDLTLRMSAGEVKIQGVEGNKDLRLHAGEVRVQVGDARAYGPVSASVWAGEIKPGPFGEGKEGLFRSFHREGPGRYSLQVSLKAGEITFQN
ncbi:hypothetical protein GETHLI_20260 [Geothrix limicola]|uniref:Adhesin domain-containing protein n=1 Tax=Geothrix limicola TaxID=2927978 RepID=A0ABQ5QFA4_9BACT|nr:hypothetical protein [Geothrix limicola]GLH73524.1 hypothetical protein GETHLI_20260 [Geothrix limicola]